MAGKTHPRFVWFGGNQLAQSVTEEHPPQGGDAARLPDGWYSIAPWEELALELEDAFEAATTSSWIPRMPMRGRTAFSPDLLAWPAPQEKSKQN